MQGYLIESNVIMFELNDLFKYFIGVLSGDCNKLAHEPSTRAI